MQFSSAFVFAALTALSLFNGKAAAFPLPYHTLRSRPRSTREDKGAIVFTTGHITNTARVPPRGEKSHVEFTPLYHTLPLRPLPPQDDKREVASKPLHHTIPSRPMPQAVGKRDIVLVPSGPTPPPAVENNEDESLPVYHAVSENPPPPLNAMNPISPGISGTATPCTGTNMPGDCLSAAGPGSNGDDTSNYNSTNRRGHQAGTRNAPLHPKANGTPHV